MGTDKTLQLLRLLVNLSRQPGMTMGLRIVSVRTAEPDDITLVMQGTNLALDLDVFEVPVEFYPLRPGDVMWPILWYRQKIQAAGE